MIDIFLTHWRKEKHCLIRLFDFGYSAMVGNGLLIVMEWLFKIVYEPNGSGLDDSCVAMIGL